jgi:ABC-type thiamine transport system ATPase subunit
MAIIGQSGCGKSTLLSLIFGFQRGRVAQFWSMGWREGRRDPADRGQNGDLSSLLYLLIAWLDTVVMRRR